MAVKYYLAEKTSKVATCLVCSQEELYVDDKEEERVQPMLGVV
jgi:hypothetical protein